jgi:hypothetical protein
LERESSVCFEVDAGGAFCHTIVKLIMNALLILAVTWVGKEYRFAGLDWSYLVVLGMIGNATFSMRFLVQWIASEQRGESVIPISPEVSSCVFISSSGETRLGFLLICRIP